MQSIFKLIKREEGQGKKKNFINCEKVVKLILFKISVNLQSRRVLCPTKREEVKRSRTQLLILPMDALLL
jgi:hypothetical protein